MKMRKKGKVYPSPSSSSSSTPPSVCSNRDATSVLKLLPTAILALASILSLEDREVLAYMITRSIKSSDPSSIVDGKKNNNKKLNTHKPPMFDCECFECYRSYWVRWDSSPNGELIHQAIEAFEEHLTTGEQAKREKNSRGKRREKMGRRAVDKLVDLPEIRSPEREADVPEITEFVPENEVVLPEKAEETAWSEEENVEEDEVQDLPEDEVAQPTATTVTATTATATNHKGLVRKVLPDVLGILNSRLWGLWNPNV